MNLSQTTQEAKDSLLTRQQDEFLALYENANKRERIAIIDQIDSFLSAVSQNEKTFWLKFRRKLEILNEPKFLFPLGKVVMTVGAKEALRDSEENGMEYLIRHQCGDWGEICEDDKKENELSIKEGFRILSAYRTFLGEKIYVITESDRSSTCLLKPEEY